MDVFPYILKFKFHLQKYSFYNDYLDSCWSIVIKKVCVTIIRRNTTHLLDMFSCCLHQQQRYNNDYTKISMFIHNKYVDILFSLIKAILAMIEQVTHITKHCVKCIQTRNFFWSVFRHFSRSESLKAWQALMQRVTITSTRYHMRYHTFSLAGKSHRKYMVTHMVTSVVMRSGYGNTLHYSLSMFVEFEKLSYPSLISISVRFHNPSHLLL